MTRIGYFLSSEEYTPDQLVEQAVLAEEAGFEALAISDHYHPWNDDQGQSSFVWSVIGAITQRTSLDLTTTVTCPTMRIHPAIIAQAAATTACLAKGAFRLGVGSGEALNEVILGDRWPPAPQRIDRLREAIEVMRKLWTGEVVDHHGDHFTVENARVYTLPDTPVPVGVSGFGPVSTALAAEVGDGFITTMADREVVDSYRRAAKEPFAQATTKVCVAPTKEEAVSTAHRLWRTSGVPGELAQVLPTPAHFEQAAQLVTPEMTEKAMSCGPDPAPHLEAVKRYVDAGFDEVLVANTGPHYAAMIELFAKDVLPELRSAS
jgi:G6PDH family F420-dependent oxidoreductase